MGKDLEVAGCDLRRFLAALFGFGVLGMSKRMNLFKCGSNGLDAAFVDAPKACNNRFLKKANGKGQ